MNLHKACPKLLWEKTVNEQIRSMIQMAGRERRKEITPAIEWWMAGGDQRGQEGPFREVIFEVKSER